MLLVAAEGVQGGWMTRRLMDQLVVVMVRLMMMLLLLEVRLSVISGRTGGALRQTALLFCRLNRRAREGGQSERLRSRHLMHYHGPAMLDGHGSG